MAPHPAGQNFDLIVLAYGPTFLAPEREDFGHMHIPGFKVAGYDAFFREHREIVARYDQIALIDDDIQADAQTLSKTFDLGRAHDLEAWQPSLTWDSYFSYATLLAQPSGAPLRHVNFVEMMCPFFKRDALLKVVDLFSVGAETAIDIFWSCVLGQRRQALAVLDAVSVVHTRPVGQLMAMNGFEETRSGYADVIGQLMTLFGVSRFPGAIPLTDAAEADPPFPARARLILPMLVLFKGLGQTPMLPRRFLRVLVTDLVKIMSSSPRIPGDPDRILAEAKRLRQERTAAPQPSVAEIGAA